MIYLYLKTHNKTRLKYLGKTTKQDPYKYRGSGKYWSNHIKKHGCDVTTQILLCTEDLEEIKQTGLFFSKLWNIVDSEEWANLMEEKGDGVDSKTAKNNALAKVKSGLHPWSEGNRSYAMDNNARDRKGLTYEEIHGYDKAQELRKSRSKTNKERWNDSNFRENTASKISETRKQKFKNGDLIPYNKGKKNPNTLVQQKKECIREDFVKSGLTRKEYSIKHNMNYTTLKHYVTGL